MARYNGGWIKVHRDILNHPVSQHGMFTFGIFIRLLHLANWKESSVIFGGKKIILLPGQLVTGLRELSPNREEDLHANKVRSSLGWLVLCEAIQQVSNNQGRLITICNWDKYQIDQENGLSISTGKLQAGHRQATSKLHLNEEVQERKKEEIHTPAGKSEVEKLVNAWQETLDYYKICRVAKLDEMELLRLARDFNTEDVFHALNGFRREPRSDTFDPGKNVYLARLRKPPNFERLRNLGAQGAGQEDRKTTPVDLTPVGAPC